MVRFADQPAHGRFVRERAVLIVIGEEAARLARAAGAAVLERTPNAPVVAAEIVTALAATHAHTVVVHAGDPELVPSPNGPHRVRAARQDVLIGVPRRVGAPGPAPRSPLTIPRAAAGSMAPRWPDSRSGTRTAALLVAESEALTWVAAATRGLLGITDGEVVLIAPDLSVGALWLAHRMLLGGGEIVTALLGAGAVDAALGEGLRPTCAAAVGCDVVVHRGGRPNYPLVLGVE